MSKAFEPLLITQSADLARLCDDLRQAGSFAFDTEFVGEDSYKPEVCLLQVATGKFHALIDPLAGLDTRPLWELISEPSLEKILHAGTEDLALAWKHFELRPANVVDLQIAAGFVGLGYPISLARLVSATLRERLHKSQTLTDWRRRPLQKDQLHYGIEDVVHLPGIWKHLRGQITKRGRIAWLQEECLALCAAAIGQNSDEKRMKRLKGTASLSRRQLAIVHAILEQRDELARRYNRPPRTVIKDHLVVELARHGWTDIEKMRTLRGLNLSVSDLKRIATAIGDAMSTAPESWPDEEPAEPTADEEIILTLITAVLRAWSEENEVAYSLLATKKDLRQLLRMAVGDEADAKPSLIQDGWRAEAVGDLLQRILEGKSSLRLVTRDGNRRLVVDG